MTATIPRRLDTRWVLFAAAAALGLLSCGGADGSFARRDFAVHVSCPPDQVVAVSRPDLHRPLPPYPTPPADVAADPSRLAFWRSQVDERRKILADSGLWEATGCGRREVLSCSYSRDGTRASCVNILRADGTLESLATPADY
jgi:hypothetical protein